MNDNNQLQLTLDGLDHNWWDPVGLFNLVAIGHSFAWKEGKVIFKQPWSIILGLGKPTKILFRSNLPI